MFEIVVRNAIQTATLVFCVVTLAVCVLNFRPAKFIMMLPILQLAHLIIYYLVVLTARSTSASVAWLTDWSALLRLHGTATIFAMAVYITSCRRQHDHIDE